MTKAATARTDLPEPTAAEVDHLAGLIDTARLDHGIYAGSASLARFLLAAGYRLVPEPEPPKWGECRVCSQSVQLNENGGLDDHDDERRGRPCIGARMTPLRLVDPPEEVSADG